MITKNNVLTLGERIKLVRKEKKQKQSEFAESLGISQSHLSGIEKNSVKPSLTIIKLICIKYNINENWLLNGVGEPINLGNLIDKEGCYAKYRQMNSYLENFLSECTNNNDLISLVSAYSYTISILSYPFEFRDVTTTSNYLKLLMNIFDEFEKLIHDLKTNGISLLTFNYISNINCLISKLPEFYNA